VEEVEDQFSSISLFTAMNDKAQNYRYFAIIQQILDVLNILKHWLVDRCEQEEDQKPLDLSISTKPVIDNTAEQQMLPERHHYSLWTKHMSLHFALKLVSVKLSALAFVLPTLSLGFYAECEQVN
jgi:hypothetical protein